MEEEILDLYFNKKLKQCDIATMLNISKSKVSKTLQKKETFIAEKQRRKELSEQKHNKDIQRRVEKSRKIKQFKNKADDLILKNFHNQAAMELSDRKYVEFLFR